MSKAACFVVFCSIAILALFGVFCFLMTTVNPPPIDDKPDKNDSTNSKLHAQANFYLRNMDPSEDLEYGMEKAYDSLITRTSHSPFYLHNLTNIFPTVKYKNPNLRKVYPPIWPPAPTTKSTIKNAKVTENILTKNSTNLTAIRTNHPIESKPPKDNNTNESTQDSIKGHRRSVNAIEKKLGEKSGSVILKILDDSGQSRIEIKLSPNEIFEKKRFRAHRSSLETDSKFSMVIKGNDKDFDINKLTDKTEIRILPNHTVIVNDDYALDIGTKNPTNKIKTIRKQKEDYETLKTGLETVENNVFSYTSKAFTFTSKLSTSTNKPFTSTRKLLVPTGRISTSTSQLFTSTSKAIPIKLYGKVKSTTHTHIKQNAQLDTINVKPLNSTSAEMFGLKVMYDNVTRSFTKPYDVSVLENKTVLY